jgi:hypothetical protein
MAETLTWILLAVCAGASVAALTGRWSPPLVISLGIGLILRIVVVALAKGHTPHDVAVSFQKVGASVVHRVDPLTALPAHQWNFLPFSDYLLAAEFKTGLAWQIAVKLLPVACDVATIALLGAFARPAWRDTARLIYALSPLAILVSAWHGQIEPIAVMLGLCALLLARRGRAVGAGIVLGAAVASKTWPLLFAPGVFRDLPRSRWWQAAAAAVAVVAVLLASIPPVLHGSIRHDLKIILGYRSFVGSWGWSGILRYLHVTGAGYSGPQIDTYQHVGTLLTAVTLAVVLVAFRRCPGPDLTVALLLAFLAVTAGFGPQYLLWPAALLCASQRAAGYVYLLLASAYTALFYLYAFPRGENFTGWPGALLQLCSIALIIAAVAAMPWSERAQSRRGADHAPTPTLV